MAAEQARAYADLAAELDVMKVKVQALEHRVDSLYAQVEQIIDTEVLAAVEGIERKYGQADDRLHDLEELLTETTMRLTSTIEEMRRNSQRTGTDYHRKGAPSDGVDPPGLGLPTSNTQSLVRGVFEGVGASKHPRGARGACLPTVNTDYTTSQSAPSTSDKLSQPLMQQPQPVVATVQQHVVQPSLALGLAHLQWRSTWDFRSRRV